MIINGIGSDHEGNISIIEDLLKGQADTNNKVQQDAMARVPYIQWNESKPSLSSYSNNIISSIKKIYNQLQQDNPDLFQCSQADFNCIIKDVFKKEIEKESSKKQLTQSISNLKTLCWIKKEGEKNFNPNGIMLHEPAMPPNKTPKDVIKVLLGKSASVHFIIDGSTGYIYSCAPLSEQAGHCAGCDQKYKLDNTHCQECKYYNITLTKKDLSSKNKEKILKSLKKKLDDKKISEDDYNTFVKEYEELIKKSVNFGIPTLACYKKQISSYSKQSLNVTKIAIEICEAPNTTIYQNTIIPAAVELCAWICYLYNFNPIGPDSENDETLVSSKIKRDKTDEYNGNSNSKFDLEKNITKTILTHREGHLFYRMASSHEDPDSYWFATNYRDKSFKEAKEMYKKAKTTENKDKLDSIRKQVAITEDMLTSIGLDKTNYNNIINEQLVPKYFRLLVNEKMKSFESLGNNKKQIINNYCNPMLLLLVPDSIRTPYQEE